MTATTGTTEKTETTARTLGWAWVVLVVITVASWRLAPAHFTDTVVASTGVTALVLVLTYIKARVILRYFMEVRSSPRWLRIGTEVWLIVLLGAIFGIYLA